MARIIPIALLATFLILGLSQYVKGEREESYLEEKHHDTHMSEMLVDRILSIGRREALPGNKDKENEKKGGKKNKLGKKNKKLKKRTKKQKQKMGKQGGKKGTKKGTKKGNKKKRKVQVKKGKKLGKKKKSGKGQGKNGKKLGKKKKARKGKGKGGNRKGKGKNGKGKKGKKGKGRGRKCKKGKCKGKKGKGKGKGKVKKGKGKGKGQNKKPGKGTAGLAKQSNCAADEANDQCFQDVYDALDLDATQATNFLKQYKRALSFKNIMEKKAEKNATFLVTAGYVLEAIGDPNNISCTEHNANRILDHVTKNGDRFLQEQFQQRDELEAKTAENVYTILKECPAAVEKACSEALDGVFNTTAKTFLDTCKADFEKFQTDNTACGATTTTAETCSCFSTQATEAGRLKTSGCVTFSNKFQNEVKVLKDGCIVTFGECRQAQRQAVGVAAACADGRVETAATVDKTVVKWGDN